MEKKSGKTLMTNDAAGMKALYAKVEGTIAGMGGDGTRLGVYGGRGGVRGGQAGEGARRRQVTFETEKRRRRKRRDDVVAAKRQCDHLHLAREVM